MALGSELGGSVARGAERDALLDRISATLQADVRVVAAWFGGSLGRGSADAWSDIDVWVVVGDEDVARFEAGWEGFIGTVGTPLLTLEAPPNAPPGGGYLLVLYPGRTGPIHVDWSWQPRSSARLPSGSRLLFDRVGLPPRAEPVSLPAEARALILGEKTAAFWVAVLLAAKAVARGRGWEAVRLTDWAATSLAETRWLAEQGTVPGFDALKGTGWGGAWTVPGEAAADQLEALRAMCRSMEGLASTVAVVGGDPRVAAGRQVRRFVDLVDRAIGGAAGRRGPAGS